MSVSAVVFDLDGTLVDSAPDLHDAAVRMLADLGRLPLTLPQVTGFVGNGVGKLVERCLLATGGSDPALLADALARFGAFYAARPTALTRPYPGVVAMLDRLAGAGLALGICTNKPQEAAERVLADLGLAPFFGAVVGGGIVALKPDPAPLRLCLDRLGAPLDRCLFVGDSETDAATAQAAGAVFLLFSGGYRHAPVEALPADFVFDAFDEAARHILARAGL